jgi:hypothetical protein
MSRTPLNRLDRRIQRPKIEPFGECPDKSDTMIGRNQVVEAQGPQFHLTALRLAQSRSAAAATTRRSLLRKPVEQSIFLIGSHRVSPRKDIVMPFLLSTMAPDSPEKHRSACCVDERFTGSEPPPCRNAETSIPATAPSASEAEA